VGSLLPWLFAQFGVASTAAPGDVSDAVKYSFGVGATLLLLAVLLSALTTREYSPELLEKFDADASGDFVEKSPERMRRHGWISAGLGVLGLLAGYFVQMRPALYVLVAACLGYGLFLLAASRMRQESAFTTILGEMDSMSASVRWLALVQFFSWFSLFAMFVYTAPAVARMHFGAQTPGSPEYEAGANWAGVLFATYNGLGALAALVLPWFVRRLGIRLAHRVNMWLGAAGLLSMLMFREPGWLLVSMVGVGFAWASIISLPYAMLANNLPSRKMGVNIGIFNIFIVIPQLLAIGIMSWLLDEFAGGNAAFALVIAAVGWLLAGWAVLRVSATAAS